MISDIDTLNIFHVLQKAEQELSKENISDAKLNAQLLLGFVLKLTRNQVFANYQRELTYEELREFDEFLERRLNHEPLQYILGETEFYGLHFELTGNELIPRQETEILVETAIEEIKKLNNPKVLEIGTGSGCIAVSIAKNCECQIDAIDINETALLTAEKNAAENTVTDKITFLRKDILTDYQNFNEYDLIVSNPPYIPFQEYNSLPSEIKDFEPASSLTDSKNASHNSDGLTFYKRIFELAKNSNPGKIIFLEIGDGKRKRIQELLTKYPFSDYSFFPDLMKIDRVLKISN